MSLTFRLEGDWHRKKHTANTTLLISTINMLGLFDCEMEVFLIGKNIYSRYTIYIFIIWYLYMRYR